MQYLQRKIEVKILEYLKIFPVVAITGPRQAGKSTTLLNLLAKTKYKYISFDDVKLRSFFYNDPDGFFMQYNNKVVFDEVQKVPEIFEYIKQNVDKDRQNYGKFILTGSSQFNLLKSVTESLAGRLGLLTMFPMQYQEIPQEQKADSIFKGAYPELVTRKYLGLEEWYSSYISTYLEKDVRNLIKIGDLRDFQRLLELLAANTSHILNMTTYAKDLGVTVQTIKRWISVLEASYIIFLLPPFYNNYRKRLVKSPKIYFYDLGLVAYLTGINSKELFVNGPMAGSIFENYIISEILKKESLNFGATQLYFLRTTNQEEIDLIIDRKLYKELIEIKLSSTIKIRMLDTINKYIESKDRGFLLYNGKEFPYKDNIKIINYADYLNLGLANNF
jgi:predicted AAA+ superfamily ATPase